MKDDDEEEQNATEFYFIFEKLMLAEIAPQDKRDRSASCISRQHSSDDNSNLINRRELFFEKFDLKASSEFKIAKDSLKKKSSSLIDKFLRNIRLNPETAEKIYMEHLHDKHEREEREHQKKELEFILPSSNPPNTTATKPESGSNNNRNSRKLSSKQQNKVTFEQAVIEKNNIEVEERNAKINRELFAYLKQNSDLMSTFYEHCKNVTSEETKLLIGRRIILEKMIDYKRPIPM